MLIFYLFYFLPLFWFYHIFSAGVAPEVNQRITQARNYARIHPGFETEERQHQKSKTVYYWPPKKDLVLQKCTKKSDLVTGIHLTVRSATFSFPGSPFTFRPEHWDISGWKHQINQVLYTIFSFPDVPFTARPDISHVFTHWYPPHIHAWYPMFSPHYPVMFT